MIKLINKYKQAFTIVGAISVLTVCYFQQRELTKLRSQLYVPTVNVDSVVNVNDSLQHRLDSLDAEMFPMEIELNRYEIAFRIFAERNPKAAEQYGNIISDETE
jgi:hypothetical protein